ncbi:MAG: hypothetical protein V3R78_01795, partial [Thermodesulfobacteriota bacterium]
CFLCFTLPSINKALADTSVSSGRPPVSRVVVYRQVPRKPRLACPVNPVKYLYGNELVIKT